MHRQSKNFFSILLLMFSSVGFAVPEVGQQPDRLLADRLLAINSIYATFTQAGNDDIQKGEFWVSKPGRFRFEAGAPLSQTIVSDGTDLWTHDRDLEQVIVASLADRAHEIPLLLFVQDAGTMLAQYEVDTYADGSSEFYLLTPVERDTPLNGITISFQDDLPASIRIENAMGEQTLVELSNVALNREVDATRFEFQPPPDADVIDDRMSENKAQD
jgi:outer membrane lipoprotein carrier protein